MERAEKWQPLAGIDTPFGSISYSYVHEALQVTLHGTKSLSLSFTGVVALRSENECPGLNPLPYPLPMLRPSETFPLLVIEHSHWQNQFQHIHSGRCHFALVASDELVQLIANPEVIAKWV